MKPINRPHNKTISQDDKFKFEKANYRKWKSSLACLQVLMHIVGTFYFEDFKDKKTGRVIIPAQTYNNYKIQEIAEETDMSKSSVILAIEQLEHDGWIKVIRRSGGVCNEYSVNWDHTWDKVTTLDELHGGYTKRTKRTKFMWITDGQVDKKRPLDDDVPDGFRKGRTTAQGRPDEEKKVSGVTPIVDEEQVSALTPIRVSALTPNGCQTIQKWVLPADTIEASDTSVLNTNVLLYENADSRTGLDDAKARRKESPDSSETVLQGTNVDLAQTDQEEPDSDGTDLQEDQDLVRPDYQEEPDSDGTDLQEDQDLVRPDYQENQSVPHKESNGTVVPQNPHNDNTTSRPKGDDATSRPKGDDATSRPVEMDFRTASDIARAAEAINFFENAALRRLQIENERRQQR